MKKPKATASASVQREKDTRIETGRSGGGVGRPGLLGAGGGDDDYDDPAYERQALLAEDRRRQKQAVQHERRDALNFTDQHKEQVFDLAKEAKRMEEMQHLKRHAIWVALTQHLNNETIV